MVNGRTTIISETICRRGPGSSLMGYHYYVAICSFGYTDVRRMGYLAIAVKLLTTGCQLSYTLLSFSFSLRSCQHVIHYSFSHWKEPLPELFQ